MVQYSPSLRKMPVRAERISRFATDGFGWALWVLVSMSTRRVPSATKGESMRNMERTRLGRDKQVMLCPSVLVSTTGICTDAPGLRGKISNEASPQQAAGYHKEGHCL